MEQKINIGTVGLGLMGCSIATCILAAGHPVTSLVRRIETAGEARERILEFLQQLNAEGILKEDPQVIIARHIITDDIAQLKGHEVIIETIIENVA
jgi:3-hydroxybutyryl-CoA dehydrogenase